MLPPFFPQALLGKASGMPGRGFKAGAWPQHLLQGARAQESGRFHLSWQR